METHYLYLYAVVFLDKNKWDKSQEDIKLVGWEELFKFQSEMFSFDFIGNRKLA